MWWVWMQRYSNDGHCTCSWRSLSDLQELFLAGKLGNKPGSLKPLDNLKIEDLRVEMQAWGVKTDGLLKPQLSSQLTEIL